MKSKLYKSPLLTFCLLVTPLCFTSELLFAQEQQKYERIVSVGGSLTEIVYELGAEDMLAAVDTSSVFPKSAMTELQNVGYMRALSTEPILSLNPDLVMVSSDAGPPSVISQLQEAGIRVEVIEDEPSIDGIYLKISKVAELVGREAKGKALISSLQADFAAAEVILGSLTNRPRVLFLLSVGVGAPMAAGEATAANTMIELAGGQNIMSIMQGYKSVSPESIVLGAPDYVLMPQRAFDGFESTAAVFKLPELIATPAAQAQNLLVFDGLYLTGFGPRTVQAILDLAQALHPDFRAGD